MKKFLIIFIHLFFIIDAYEDQTPYQKASLEDFRNNIKTILGLSRLYSPNSKITVGKKNILIINDQEFTLDLNTEFSEEQINEIRKKLSTGKDINCAVNNILTIIIHCQKNGIPKIKASMVNKNGTYSYKIEACHYTPLSIMYEDLINPNINIKKYFLENFNKFKINPLASSGLNFSSD